MTGARLKKYSTEAERGTKTQGKTVTGAKTSYTKGGREAGYISSEGQTSEQEQR